MNWFRKTAPKVILVPVVFDEDITPYEQNCINHWNSNPWKGVGHFHMAHYLIYKQYLKDAKTELNEQR